MMSKMRAAILAVMSLAAVGLPATAGEIEATHIEDLLVASAESYDYGDTVGFRDGIALLSEASLDPEASPECRRYADTALSTLLILEATFAYPESVTLDRLRAILLDPTEAQESYLPVTQQACLLAL